MDSQKSNVLQIIGNNIKTIRQSREMTQEQVAEELNKSNNWVSLIELGKLSLNAPTIIEICNLFEVDTSVIFNGLVEYKIKDKKIIDSLSILSNEDKKIIENLIEFIMSKNSK